MKKITQPLLRSLWFTFTLLLSPLLAAQDSVPGAPQLSAMSSGGVTLYLDWPRVSHAQGYYLLYAPYPFQGAGTIQRIDLNDQNTFSVDFIEQQDLAYLVAVQAYNSAGTSVISNIETIFLEDAPAEPVVLPLCLEGQSPVDLRCKKVEEFAWNKTIEETPYKEGLVHGIKRRFGENHQPLLEISYYNGVKHGWEINYAPDGTVLGKALYIDGMLQTADTGMASFKWKVVRILSQEKLYPYCESAERPQTATCRWNVYENGKLKAQVTLKNGENYGLLKNFDKAGLLGSQYNYEGDTLHGITGTYVNGIQVSRGFYIDGKSQGRQKGFSWYGALVVESNLVDGRILGDQRWYRESGALESIRSYYPPADPTQMSVQHGRSIYYHENGAVWSEVNYVWGKAEGIFHSYWPSGSIMGYVEYRNGEIVGTAFEYHENGVVKDVIPYLNGGIFGTRLRYHPNGRVDFIFQYPLPDIEDGERQYFYDSGQLKMTLPVKQNKFDGLCRIYDESGRLTMEVLYKEGKVVSRTTIPV